jgi:hypothetical protein
MANCLRGTRNYLRETGAVLIRRCVLFVQLDRRDVQQIYPIGLISKGILKRSEGVLAS